MTDVLSSRIREARVDAGLTQEQMAPQIGVTLRTLTRYESGETTRISLDKVARIARVTAKPIAWFLGDREETRA